MDTNHRRDKEVRRCTAAFSRWRQETREWLARYPLLVIAILLIAGGKIGNRLLSANLFVGSSLLVLGSCLALLSLGIYLRRFRRANARLEPLDIVCLALAVLVAGCYNGWLAQPQELDELSSMAERAKQPIAVRLTICSAAVWMPNPQHREQDLGSEAWSTQWTVRCTAYRDRQRWVPVNTSSTLRVAGRVEHLLPGDELEVHGSFRAILPPSNPGGYDFAERSRQEGRFVWFAADSLQQIEVLGSTWSQPWQRLRGYAVRFVDRQLHRWVTHGQAPLAAALVFGQRQQVDWEDQQELMATGTLHMLAISGMHVEIVAGSVLIVCWLLGVGDSLRLAVLLMVCVLYAGLADGKPPVLRAAILVLAFEMARFWGRPARLSNALSLAAILLFLIRATYVDNVGVHLSFLAVATIGVFVLHAPRLSRVASKPLDRLLMQSSTPSQRLLRLWGVWLGSMLRLSFWVWLITSPLVWFNFHVIAPIAIPLNVLVSIPLGFALLSGVITGVLGWFSPIGWIAGNVCGECLHLIQWLIESGERIPGGHLWSPAPPVWWILAFYLLVTIWLLAFRHRQRITLAMLLCGWMLLGVGLHAFGPRGWSGLDFAGRLENPKRQLTITFLDVGHGTSVLLEFPDGRVWLYDAGHLGAAERSHQSIAAALWYAGTSRIERIILSHADRDHYNAVQGLMDRFQVASVASTHEFWGSDDRAVQQLVGDLKTRRVRLDTWAAGSQGEVAGVRWKVLHPREAQAYETDNASSLCLVLELGGQRVLLPGDLEGSGVGKLLEMPDRPCHVLMAPHHGSLTRDPTQLLQWCRPDYVVISGNHQAMRAEVMQRFAPWTEHLAITFRDGAVQYRIGANSATTAWYWDQDDWRSLR